MSLEALVKSRKRKQNITAYKAMLASPVVGAVTIPANAQFKLVAVSGAAAGTIAGTIAGPSSRTIRTPVLSAGQAVIIEQIEKGSIVTPASGFDLFVHIGFGKFRKIAGAS